MANRRFNILARLMNNERLVMVVSGFMALVLSFTLGVKTSDDINPFHLTNADSTSKTGDMDGDGVVTHNDAIRALEVALGYEEVTDRDRHADPNGDMRITVEDALTILKSIR